MHLEGLGLAAATINQRLAAVKRLAFEATDSGLLSHELAAGIQRVKGAKQLGRRSGNWLSLEQSTDLLNSNDGTVVRQRRDHAMLAILPGWGLRRAELVQLCLDDIQTGQGHWVILDLVGKARMFARCQCHSG
jgi:site-specific recombinase XerD